MKFGISLPNNQGVPHVSILVELAREAEALGFHSVWTSEHLFHSTYVAERLGSAPYHEALTVLNAVAAITQTVRLGTSVLVLPWHDPVRLAKMIATLDDLSDGRVNLGVGVAVTEDEYANLGVDFHQRGRIADEMLAAMRALWTEDVPVHEGKYHSFSGLRFEPKPVQTPLPVYVGGGSDAAIRRLKKFGQYWHPLSLGLDNLRDTINKHQLSGNFGISPRMVIEFLDEPFDRPVSARRTMRGTADELRQMIDGFEELGVDEIVLDPATPDPEVFRSTMARAKKEFEI